MMWEGRKTIAAKLYTKLIKHNKNDDAKRSIKSQGLIIMKSEAWKIQRNHNLFKWRKYYKWKTKRNVAKILIHKGLWLKWNSLEIH